MWEMRYQYWASDGIRWTKWFSIPDNMEHFEWQLKNKLRNEYRYIENR